MEHRVGGGGGGLSMFHAADSKGYDSHPRVQHRGHEAFPRLVGLPYADHNTSSGALLPQNTPLFAPHHLVELLQLLLLLLM